MRYRMSAGVSLDLSCGRERKAVTIQTLLFFTSTNAGPQVCPLGHIKALTGYRFAV